MLLGPEGELPIKWKVNKRGGPLMLAVQDLILLKEDECTAFFEHEHH